MRSLSLIVAAVAALVFLTGTAKAQQCKGACPVGVAPAAAIVPSYSYAAPVVAASPVFVQPLLFVVPGVPTTAVTAPPAAAPVQQYAPQAIPAAVQAVPVFAAPQVFAAPVVVKQQHVVAAAPVVVQQVHAGGGLLGRAVVTQQRQPRVQVQTVRTVVRNR